MNASREQLSKRYALAQTLLLCAFAAVTFLLPGPSLFLSTVAMTIGTALCAIGILVIVLAFASIRGTIQIAPEPRPGKELVQKGIYHYLRHPIYTGIIFCVVGLWLKKSGAWVAVAGAVVIIFLVMKVRVEEALLGATYSEYAKYKMRTWGLFPGIRG